jgi:tetratricopeptide (TPR) repeat protein/GTPase SAR1 family protein
MVTNNKQQVIEASEQIVRNFLARFLPEHDYEPLLLYAALPLVLTPELLHYLRHRFVPHIPWVAEIDILLAEELFRERGYEQYIMNTPIRIYLLQRAKQRHNIYTEDAARLMVQYLHAFARTQPYATLSDMQAQQWSALAFIKDTRSIVAQEITAAMENASSRQLGGVPSNPELKRLVALAEQLAPELENHPEIIEHAQRIRSILRGDTSASTVSEAPVITSSKHRIFISYTRNDLEFAQRIAYDLRSYGHDIWIDIERMPLKSTSFTNEIRDSIVATERFILIIGSDTAGSEYVRAEWEYALDSCLPIYPIRRSGDYVPNALHALELVDIREDDLYEQGLTHLLRLLESDIAPLGELHGVPPLPSSYLKRKEELQGIKEQLLSESASQVVVASHSARLIVMQGMGGIGKTTTAVALCHDCEIRRSFRDGIYWLTFGQSPDQLAQYVALGRMLGDDATAFKDEVTSRTRIQTLLENRRSMIVLDDVWSYSHIRDFISGLSNSVFLITTRNESVVDAVNSRGFVEQDKATTDPIYIIHSTHDDAVVTRIVDILSAQDIPLWVDHRDIQPGENWSELIQDALRESRAGLFVLSAASVRSKECTAEWRYILSSGKPLYILRLENVAVEDIPYRLALVQYIDLMPDFDEGIQALIHILKEQRGTADFASKVPLRLTESALIEEELLGLKLAGRQAELAEALTILRTRPLIIVGVGGVGKSRLATAIVTEGGWQNVVWYQCSTYSSANDVYAFIRKHYSLLPLASIEEIIVSIKQASKLLVVLDNAEELDVARRSELSQLIEIISNAGVAVCITSRAAWEVPGSRVMSLAPLSSTDALQMVFNAAEFYDLSWSNPAEAAEIANAARNHPRLIVWAVERMRDYPVREVVNQLINLGTENAEGALDEATGQAIQQLSDSARAALRALAVCRGGFTYEAARAITQTSTDDDLSELERYRLVTFVRKNNRYNIDDLVIATIGEDAAARRSHFEYYLALAQEHARKQDYVGLDVESANIDAAFEWAISVDPELALNLATACADFQSNRGRFAQIVDWAERIVRALQGLNDIGLLASAQNNLGVAWTQLPTGNRGENLRRAIAAYHEALRFYTPEATPLDYALTQSNLGNAHRDLAALEDRETNLHRAIAAYQEAMRFRTPLAAPLDYASTQNSLGAVYSALSLTGDKASNLRRAIAAYEAALVYYTPQTVPLNYATTQNNIGVAYSDLAQIEDRAGNLRRAVAAYEAALVYRTPESAPLDYALTQNNLGVAYSDLAQVQDRAANLRRAIAAYEQALPLYRTVGDRLGEAATLRQLGDGWNALGDVQRSLGFYEQSLALSHSLGNQLGEASTLAGIAHQYRSTNDLQRALEYFQQALLLYREVGDKNGEAATLTSMGQLNMETGDPSPAHEYLSSALVLYRELGRNDMAEAIEKNLANLGGSSDSAVSSTEPDGYLPISWGYRYRAVWQNEYIAIHGSQNEPLMLLEGHTAKVNGVLELPDRRLLSWADDRTLRIWSQNGEPLAVLSGHSGSVVNADLLEDGRIRSRDTSGAELIWSPDGQLERQQSDRSSKLRVYVSGTQGDLEEHRKGLLDVIQQSNMSITLPDSFSYGDDVLEQALGLLAQADIFILLMGFRYGFVPGNNNPSGLSITELEYNEAVRLNKPILAFVIDEQYPVSSASVSMETISSQKLRNFKSKITRHHMVAFFTTPEDLKLKVIQALAGTEARKRTTVNPITNPFTLNPVTRPMFFGRRREFEILRSRVQDGVSVAVIGPTRIGKTSLLKILEEDLRNIPDYNVIFLNVETFAGGNGRAESFLRLLGRRLSEFVDVQIPSDRDMDLHTLGFELSEIIESQFKVRRLVIIIDEIAGLFMGDDQDAVFLAQWLRSLVVLSKNLALVISAIRELNRIEPAANRQLISSLSGVFYVIRLLPLDYQEVKAMVEHFGVFEPSADLIDFIFQQTEGQPYLIQTLCMRLYDWQRSKQIKKLSKEDFEIVKNEFRKDLENIASIPSKIDKDD